MPPAPHRALLAGIHVGGTNILAGVFDSDLEPLGCAKLPTHSARGPEIVLGRMRKVLLDAVENAEARVEEVAAIGAGLPGCVDPGEGVVRLAVNLGWKDVAVRGRLQEALQIPVAVDNDANLSLLGIYEQELCRNPGTNVVLGVFIGSGIGGAILLGGKAYRGERHSAAEVGHMIVDARGPRCACGRRGCFEALASRTAVVRDLRAAASQGHKTILSEMVGPEFANVRSGHLRKAFRQGDKVTRRVLHRAAEHIGVALSNLVLLYDPGLIVLGGGLMEAVGAELLPTIQRICGEMLPQGSPAPPEIIVSSLADSAGLVGGALLARTALLKA